MPPRTAYPVVALVAVFLFGCGQSKQATVSESTAKIASPHSANDEQPAVVQSVDSRAQAISRARNVDTDVTAASRRLNVLASDSLFGRGYVFDGHNKAADYIASEFQSAGIRPIGQSYFAHFEFNADIFPETVTLTVNGATLRVGDDFVPFPGSASGVVRAANLVDARHGLVNVAGSVDDYSSGVEGPVVVVRDGTPDSLSAVIPPEEQRIEYKAELAAQRGALALIVLTDNLVYGLSRRNTPIPVFRVAIDSWPDDATVVAFSVDSRIDTPVSARNVVGIVPASKTPSDSIIVVTAHYDHKGAIGPDAVFNGANDNASGTTMLFDIGNYFAKHRPSRDIVLIAFSGEEEGLLGSRDFVANPTIPLDRVSHVVNLDMVASAEDGVVVMGGVEHPIELERIRAIGQTLDRLQSDSRRIGSRSVTPISDHYPFAERGIKSFYIYANKGTQPYHSIHDISDTIEWEDYIFIRELVTRFIEQSM